MKLIYFKLDFFIALWKSVWNVWLKSQTIHNNSRQNSEFVFEMKGSDMYLGELVGEFIILLFG